MRRFLLLLALTSLAGAEQLSSSTLREQHYMVYGRSIDAIQSSIIERTPVRTALGAFAGGTRSSYLATYRLVPVSRTDCMVRNVLVKVELVVTLPRLAPGTLPAAVAAEWQRYYKALRAHEYQHVASAREAALSTGHWLSGMRLGEPCHLAAPRLRAAIEAYIRQLDERDQQLDAHTDHGRSQGAWLDARVR